jgi:hypothetical protein
MAWGSLGKYALSTATKQLFVFNLFAPRCITEFQDVRLGLAFDIGITLNWTWAEMVIPLP